ncbi:hypothetical protein [Limnoglobus roseus]|uniref:Uncharacterized protein n=1 Tax=Limnoglobus roseus TaxID=2598579 RepID=A0A5C1A7M8_9BACT|nr:hypothetical protein [Limnoglobus roseus]QEL14227.1 hypothetical protein PX52LOC_01097 [Limnoglobus roseus]
MRRLLLTAILSFAAATPASACLNDATLKGSEREFRSQYQTTPPAPTATPDTSGYSREILFRGLGGTVLIVGAMVLLWRRSPSV